MPGFLPPRAPLQGQAVLHLGTFPETLHARGTRAHTLFPPPLIFHTELCLEPVFPLNRASWRPSLVRSQNTYLTVFHDCTVEEGTFSRCRCKGSLWRSLPSSHDGSGRTSELEGGGMEGSAPPGAPRPTTQTDTAMAGAGLGWAGLGWARSFLWGEGWVRGLPALPGPHFHLASQLQWPMQTNSALPSLSQFYPESSTSQAHLESWPLSPQLRRDTGDPAPKGSTLGPLGPGKSGLVSGDAGVTGSSLGLRACSVFLRGWHKPSLNASREQT